MRKSSMFLSILLSACAATSATAQVSFSVRTPTVSIGIHVPLYPTLVRVPGYPVYYAPQMESNYFFYDSVYWIYYDDNWYASSWYNGPWELVDPDFVPLYILRVPVRYYRQPPVYFHSWFVDAPPRWGDHWGNRWEQRRSGWDRWDRRSVPTPAPLPSYQRQYSGDRYPQGEQQHTLRNRHYTYQPRDAFVRQSFQSRRAQSAPATPAVRDRRQPLDMTREQSTEQQRRAPQREQSSPTQAPPIPQPPQQQRRQAEQTEQPARQHNPSPPNSNNHERGSKDDESDKHPKREHKPKQENDRGQGGRDQSRQQDRR